MYPDDIGALNRTIAFPWTIVAAMLRGAYRQIDIMRAVPAVRRRPSVGWNVGGFRRVRTRHFTPSRRDGKPHGRPRTVRRYRQSPRPAQGRSEYQRDRQALSGQSNLDPPSSGVLA